MTLSEHQLSLLAMLADLVRRGQITQVQIQAVTGVHQSQISRILRGQVRRTSANVDALCKYAKTRHGGRAGSRSPAGLQRLHAVASRLWNGTPDHAQALADAMEAIGRVQEAAGRGAGD